MPSKKSSAILNSLSLILVIALVGNKADLLD